MSIFWDQLFTLLIFLVAMMLFIGVYKEISRSLSSVAEQLDGADHGRSTGEKGIMRRRLRPVQEPAPEIEADKAEEELREEKPARAVWRQVCSDTMALIRCIFSALNRREVLQRVGMDMLVMVLISIMLAIFSGSSIGGLDIYMSTFLPMMGVMLILFLFTESVNGSRVFAVMTGVLILTGVSLQGLLKLSDEVPSASELVLFASVSMCLSIAGCMFLRIFAENIPRKGAVILLNIAVVGLYLVLMVFGTTVANTRAWLIVGGFSFQLTELTKVLSLAIFGLVFTDQNITSDKRLLSALFTLAVNGVCLLLINELGTLCILGLAFFMLGFIYLPSVRKLTIFAAVLVLFAAMVLGICFICNRIVNPEAAADPTEPTAATQTESTEPSETVEPTESTDPTDSTEATEAAGSDGEEEEKSIVERLLSLGDKIWRKFKLRIDLLLHSETVDPLGGGYQSRMAQNALRLSGWLGSVFEVDIPVVQSDYIFTFLVLKMGVVYAVVILLIMLLMLMTGILGSLSNPVTGVAAMGAAFTLGMVVQSLIAAASATGAFILIGLPFSFLSDGGTAAVTNYLMAVFVIYATGRTMKVAPVQQKQTGILRRKEHV